MTYKYASMGEVLVDLKRQDVTDVGERARQIQSYIDHANGGNGYEYDRYMQQGAATCSLVVTEHSGETKKCILWCVNHYLSLNRHPQVIASSAQALRDFGTGCGTSAASCGMSSLHKQVEKRLAGMVDKEKAILFSTGFTANTAAISQLPGKKDLIIFDRECHSSIINGLKLSEAKWVSFKHNNVANLKAKLSRYADTYQNIFVVVESAYSMSGDLAPLNEIVALKKQHRFYLYVDEAHTFGIYGDSGQGYCHAEGVSEDVDFIMATLSKATASIGGFIATEEKYCSLLKWSDPYVFQACIPPSDAATILACLDEIESHPEMLADLHEKNRYMRQRLLESGFKLGSSRSPIIPIFIEDYHKLHEVVRDLYEEGIYSTPICFPAVKPREGRIRLILNSAHTFEDIDVTVEALERSCRNHGLFEERENSRGAVYNDAYFENRLDSAVAQANRAGELITVALVKIDNYAEIEARYTGATAESVVQQVITLFNGSLRATDLVAPSAKDRIGVVLVDADTEQVAGLCERLIQKVNGYAWESLIAGLSVHVSLGLSEASSDKLELLQSAERNLKQRAHSPTAASATGNTHNLNKTLASA